MKNCQFVQATGKPSVSNDIMKCNSYDAIIADKDAMQILNKLIVQNNFAEFDPDTKHFLDVYVDWEAIQFTDDLNEQEDIEEDWDNEEKNQNEMATPYHPNGFGIEKKFPRDDAYGSDDSEKEPDMEFSDEQAVEEFVSEICFKSVKLN